MRVPYISREDVGAALASLIHKTHKSEGLEHLLLVDLRVNAPAMPASDEARSFAVRDLLVSEIMRAVSDLRTTFRLDPIDENAPIDAAQAALKQLRGMDAHELIVWSVLYYRYVRSDLGFGAETLADLIAVHTRTFTRYSDDGITLLTERLIAAELEARSAQQARRLLAALPYSVPVRMVGRDDLMISTEALLPTLSPCHLLITGVTGVGKTTFVQEVLRRLITAGGLDELIWIDQPESAAFVRHQIAETLLREGGEVTLRDTLLLYPVAIVLDGLEGVAADEAALRDLLRDLGAALVCLINRTSVPLDGVAARVILNEIDQAATDGLIDEVLRGRTQIDAASRREIARDLFEQVGGNPLALKLAAMQWESRADWALLRSQLHERLFGQVYASLDEQEKLGWCALALFPDPASLDDLNALWQIEAATVGTLLRLAVVEPSGDERFRLGGAAREYIRQKYAAETETKARFDQLIATMGDDVRGFDILEQMLLTSFPATDLAEQAAWIEKLWRRGERHEHWARWQVILEKYLKQGGAINVELRISYGVCLRRLSDWEGARQVFYNVVAECGRDGRFGEQARALVEWSVLARYQGDYEGAQQMIGQAKRYAERMRDSDLLQALRLQEAQILVQRGRGAEAYELLSALPQSAQVLKLESEAQLALGNDRMCRALAERARTLMHTDEAAEASLATIIGRSYEHEGDAVEAHRWFSKAMTRLERTKDAFTLARAQTNLAAVLIPMGRLSEAGALLRQAEEAQRGLGDKVGLNVTRHNWSILGGYIAR